MLKWESVYAEMQKCVILCSNCHGEVHEGFHVEKVMSLWQEKWQEIRVRSSAEEQGTSLKQARLDHNSLVAGSIPAGPTK